MDRLEYLQTGILHVKKSSEIVGVNAAALSYLGYPEDFNFQETKFLELCTSLKSNTWIQLIQTLESQRAIEFSAIFLSYNGQYVELKCLATHEIGASVVDIYLFSPEEGAENTSVDYRKLEICESFLETHLMDINIKNTDLEYEVTSRLYEETFSLEPGEAIGKKPKDIYPPAFAEHVASHDRMVLNTKQVVTQIDVVPYTNKHLLVQKFPLYQNESVSGIGVFAVDITSLKDSERRLLESKNKFSDYVDLCEDILWEADSNWELRETNIAELSNISGIELPVGGNVLEIFRSIVSDLDSFNDFIDSLQVDEIHKRVFELQNGVRVRLGIKPCDVANLDKSTPDSQLVYRGVITILRVA